MENKKIYTYRGQRIRSLKNGVSVKDYLLRHPDAIITTKPPCLSTLEKYVSEGIARAIDGCGGIEPDGYCEHGRPSWLLALGYI